MHDVEELSFHELGERELLKGPIWFLGLLVTLVTAAYTYCQQGLASK